ncbi:DUF4197 domain-containing protein [Marinobacterium arenosum]|uniref:DUF4197 domain-containing protein n=1 Tax=Marinobacterium arenosum TaxID=2862496 RepID=UPI001C973DA1|nr:DUF4197 domain-containing protein [Marinobacterium arenosum]MBY4677650.1 DUF4197 domain-containing protein [Marinobacterium arenosum]
MRKVLAAALLLLPLSGQAGWGDLLDKAKESAGSLLQQQPAEQGQQLSNATLIDGLKEALAVGSERAIERIAQPGGYLDDSQIRIPLPASIETISGILRKYGLADLVDQFDTSLSRAAEQAAPQATGLVLDAIKQMSFEDAKRIYQGPDDAATQYFREKTGPQIAELFRPVISDSLNQVGATRYYNTLASEAASLPLVGQSLELDLTEHVTQSALDGLFLKLAAEEKLIRQNPAARTTELLKQLWGS